MMEDDNEQARSIRSWMKPALSFLSLQSLVTRQILSAISGLLVNLLVTPLVVRFVDDDFQFSSLERALLISLVSMLLAFIFRCLMKPKQHQNWYTSPRMGTDTAVYINPTIDYSDFTSFRFPIPDNLLPVAQVDNKLKSAPVSVYSEPVRMLQSSLSEHPPPPPPSYQSQWVTSKPTSSSSNSRFSPSAPPSPMKGKGKSTGSRLKNKSPKASLLHQSLLNPLHTFQEASKPPEPPRLRKKEASSAIPRKKVNRYRAGQASGQLASWAWGFMEESSFAKFKREYANLSSSSFGAFSTGMVRNEGASSRNRKSDANEREKAQVPLRIIENDYQLQTPAPLQAVTLEVNGGVMSKGTKCGACLTTFLSSFCFQRPKRRWNSRRYRQIAHAPLLWSPSPIHPPTTIITSSPPMGCCI